MGLYLAVFDGDEEVEGVEVGRYDDFSCFRNTVVEHLEGGTPGSRFPALILHSDCDGEWSPEQADMLSNELVQITTAFKNLAPVDYNSEWQRDVAKTLGIVRESLYDCFFDVDGEPLLERLIKLTKISRERNLPILFQ